MSLEDLAFPPTVQDDVRALTKNRAMCDDGSDCSTPFCPCASGQDMVPTSEAEKINIHDRNLLALDLGTHTGWAIRRRDGTIIHGTESFSPRKSWGPGQRWLRYRSWLSALIDREQVHAITFERVVFGHSSASASDVYGGFRAITEMVADAHNCDIDSVAVPTVKKHFTGSGRAKKPDMIAEARRRGFRPDSDNSADALAILHFAISREES